MSLAHEEPFGGHLGEEKTRERIKLSFIWPKMRREIDKFCKSCEKCQLKARSLVMDRVPITPILKSLTAKAVCEELKNLFMDADVRSNAKIQYTRTSRIIRNRGKMESNI